MGEPQVSALLPYLVSGLQPNVTPDYRAATLMIITQLASRVAMSADLAAGERAEGSCMSPCRHVAV